MNKGIVFGGMGFELVGMVLGSLYVGQVIDKHMGWSGIGVAVMLVASLVSWFVHLLYLLKRFESEDEKDTKSH